MIPNQSYFFSGIVVTLYFFFLFSFVLHTLASPKLDHCRHDQRDALLEFKHEFPRTHMDARGYNDMNSWNKSGDCCSWGAVTCDAKYGKVISLDFYSVALNNTLKPNSALFKLQYLQNLSLHNCFLYGEIPSSFGNLSHLTKLDFRFNKLVGQVPSSFGNLTQLRYLNLGINQLSGKVFGFFANFTKLIELDLSGNYFEPELLPDMSRFHNLEEFLVSNFFGPFPTSLFTIPSLQRVDLRGNNFTGSIDFGNMSFSSRLRVLDLADNNFDGSIPESISKFLNLRYLDLSNNKLEGKVPGCLWGMESLKLSHNFLSSFEKSSEVLNQREMNELRLDSNSFNGPFPHRICEIILLLVLDLSNNSFSGLIDPCLRSFTDSLRVLNLRNNKFSGILPDVFVNATNLRELDVSQNRLEGKLPKTLVNCEAMDILNVEGNKFKDKFPSWLGSLPSLNVLKLRSNQLYGPLYHHHISIGFQNIKVIDVSHNDFTGTFPSFYFSGWSRMRRVATLNPEIDDIYMGYYITITNNTNNVTRGYGIYSSSMEMVHKGVDTEFEKIRKDYTTIDFSRNKFYGKIPESIGLLKGLRFLNLSGNAFKSDIPQSLANLKNLEALDLSQNQLSGQIPRDLGKLNFLSVMNFSYNNLEGPISQGTQFQRQNCSSFMHNPKLNNLEEICGKTHVPSPTPQELEEVSESEENVINWVAAGIAYGPCVFCGLVIGHIFSSHKHEWFMEKFRRNKPSIVMRSAR